MIPKVIFRLFYNIAIAIDRVISARFLVAVT
jgi:hypothetical protein